MWADIESGVDFLNYSEVSETVCELVADDDMLPMSLGIYGTWGVGKSSILRLVSRQLEADPRNLVIPFDAWLYQDFDEAKSALMTVIAKNLYDATPETLKEKASAIYRRVNKIKALGLAVDIGAMAVGIPTFGLVSKALGSAGDLLSGTGDQEDVDALKAGVKDATERGDGLLQEREKRNAPEEIAAFRKELGELLGGMDRRLVVFVDNLDRCLPGNAIATLEAMRLFLFLPRTAFVVAADEDMIRLSVEKHFSNPGDRHVTDYLDKLIQIPVRVPKLGLQEVRAYLAMLAVTKEVSIAEADREALRSFLISKLRKSWSQEPHFTMAEIARMLALPDDSPLMRSLETMDRIAPLLAHSVRINGNPRIVKRMLNVIRMRSSVARRREMPLGESYIAKLALFERCMGEEAILGLGAMINSASEGKPVVFAELEAVEGEIPVDQLPEAWRAQSEFAANWLRLDPKFAGMDLRPLVYLSRETLPLRSVAARLTPSAAKAVDALLKTATMGSPASRDAIAGLAPEETGDVMDELVAAMGRNLDWSRARSDFRGAVLLAKSSRAAHDKLARFVGSIPKPPPWMVALMKDTTPPASGRR
ncbi:P-loop NTPase fold protein [Aureimonas sp. AU4]|uniref:KAP family P-loop NTPase fold protein n=1 Tax=Aureimonas sp. AU4 TaxID=1638163 RepID=UPI0007853319|nr:P-loop NTPase fold protein [Aureimonas sp. AU4]